jgi:V/A-type H+-transporting ATPase subunit G/H
MDSKIALDKIKETEVQAQRIIEEAKKQARDILQEAQLAQESIIKTMQEKARLAAKELKLQIEQETQKEISGIQAKNQDDTRLIKEKASVNPDKALEFIKDKIDLWLLQK